MVGQFCNPRFWIKVFMALLRKNTLAKCCKVLQWGMDRAAWYWVNIDRTITLIHLRRDFFGKKSQHAERGRRVSRSKGLVNVYMFSSVMDTLDHYNKGTTIDWDNKLASNFEHKRQLLLKLIDIDADLLKWWNSLFIFGNHLFTENITFSVLLFSVTESILSTYYSQLY